MPRQRHFSTGRLPANSNPTEPKIKFMVQELSSKPPQPIQLHKSEPKLEKAKLPPYRIGRAPKNNNETKIEPVENSSANNFGAQKYFSNQ